MDSNVTYRAVPGYEGYLCGDDGSIWSCRVNSHDGRLSTKWKRLRPSADKNTGYLRVKLRIRCRVVSRELAHRVVLLSFVGPCPEGMEARHVNDNDRQNNRLGNLAWGTHAENIADKKRHGALPTGERHHNAKLSDADVVGIRADYRPGVFGCKRLAKKYHTTPTNIKRIVRGKARVSAPSSSCPGAGSETCPR